MTNQVLLKSVLWSAAAFSIFSVGCAVAAKNADESAAKSSGQKESSVVATREKKNVSAKRTIDFAPNSPADTIRMFYQNLRDKRFREAIMMTNLRVAVEGLTDAEIQDLSADFETIAAQVPAELPISGEIITADKATVTVKLPNEETGAVEDQVFSLQRQNDAWVYLMADAATEATAKREGKNYFFMLRRQVHHAEAQSMIGRITKAEMVYALQNGGLYADLPTLVAQGLLPADAQSADSTGYRYGVQLSSDKKKYAATAEPAVYGKTGTLSFLMQVDEKGKTAGVKSKDNKGNPLKQ